MILVDFFSEADCKGTEIVEGWYCYDDSTEEVQGPYDDAEAAYKAAEHLYMHQVIQDEVNKALEARKGVKKHGIKKLHRNEWSRKHEKGTGW